jgi:ribosomal protein S18 acetylase RimI-like enzyme
VGAGARVHRLPGAGDVVTVRPLDSADIGVCGEILESLPDWFGLPDVNAGYIESLHRLPGYVAVDGDRVVGFLAIETHSPTSAEVTVMGVRPDAHRGGHGRALIDAAIGRSRTRGVVASA